MLIHFGYKLLSFREPTMVTNMLIVVNELAYMVYQFKTRGKATMGRCVDEL